MESARRQALGQWFTPAPVADLTLALAVGDRSASVLDPSCGDGAFLHRAVHAGVNPDQLHGVDVDPQALNACRQQLPQVDLRCADIFSIPPSLPGYDAVVGNPPYVRQERLTPAQKQDACARLVSDWPELPAAELEALLGRGDLAAAFLLRSLRLVRPGGRLSFVVSSALLDAGYADKLWSLVNRVARVVAIVDAPRERWFREAAVNTMIVTIERIPAGAGDRVVIARLREGTAAAAQRVAGVDDLAGVADVRIASALEPAGWATAMRAPAAWFELVDQATDLLVPLARVADIRRGVTSGANSFFYMTRDEAKGRAIETALLVPLVRSPRDRGAANIAIDPQRTSHVALVAPAGLDEFPGARAYVHAHRELADRPTLRNRTPWWTLPCHPARLFLTKAYSSRFVQRFAPRPMLADQRVYAVYPHADVDVELLAAVLNSSFTALALESLGRSSMGEGALEWTVADALRLPVLDPRRIADSDAVRAAFTALMTRAIGDVRAEAGQADRLVLDGALLPAVDLARLNADLIESVERRCSRSGRYLSV